METRRRTIVKSIIWTLIGLFMMALVGILMTGSATVGGAMAVINAAIGLVSYALYERVWAAISWGRHA
ncbi:hypothetical protein OB2597_00835 [Pseudooceanicola batsensis HTCC2597]|uniref:DUF2061 domain-containing protein n=1 Tax=Pseudooceanicola batsensis (strain ATCC BAA-863 / DSM 15984 / KCTC 12145 / HTCC2597) TaxID=252305 RepID=A3U1Y4_PSEBH|nr:DUF2061 domain-containing protein [Pseudooceanicola batsensis]EAQ01918.1 hypothetical protein OB2597_00835 [Pseudooceanicola batsensis HTCC2597]